MYLECEKKTKEMIVEFKRNRFRSNTISIMGKVKVAEEYKYLLVHLLNYKMMNR